MSTLVIFLLIAIFLFPDTVILSPVFPIPRIIKILILLLLVLSYVKTKMGLNEFNINSLRKTENEKVKPDILLKIISGVVSLIILFGNRFNLLLKQPLKTFITVWIILITYVFLIDLIQNQPLQGVNDLLINLSFLLMFIAFLSLELKEDFHSKKFTTTVQILSALIIFIGLIQIFQPQFTYENIFSHNPIINQNINYLSTNYIVREGRITGPFNISIGYSILLGYIIIFSLIHYEQEKETRYLLLLIAASIISIFTFTRSLIYGMLPSILIGKYILNKNGKKLIKGFGFVAISTIVFFLIITQVIEHKSERVKSFVDPGTGAKLIANYYGAIGALKQNPFFGIPFEKNIDVIFSGIEARSLDIMDNAKIADTNHNQFIWFLKYYGILGFIIFIIFNIYLLKVLFNIKNAKYKIISLIFYIFFLQFSLLHNNFFFRDFYFLTFLGVTLNRDKYFNTE